MIKYTWSIVSAEVDSGDGVVFVHWKCNGKEGSYSESVRGVVGFTPNPSKEDYVEFEALTRDTLMSWVDTRLGVEGKKQTEDEVATCLKEVQTLALRTIKL